ncbi:{ManC} Mannose-6-phosphate isomerase [Rhabdaerophilaceae bacterium]
MSGTVLSTEGVASVRDPRYATLWELSGPQTHLALLSAAFVEVDPGSTSPLHWHAVTEEIYMIVAGTGEMYLGDDVIKITAGDCVSIPTRTVHAIGNSGVLPLRMWVVTSPPYTEGDDFEIETDGMPPE